jgi:hypothetical protein
MSVDHVPRLWPRKLADRIGVNTAEQAAVAVLLDPNTHCQAPLIHASHHRRTLVHLSRFRVSPILTTSRFRRFCTFVSSIVSVSLVGISLLRYC